MTFGEKMSGGRDVGNLGETVVTRKPANRLKSAQFNVRMPDAVRESLMGAIGELGLQRAGGGEMTRTDLIEYWSVWFARLGAEGRREWARAYRDEYRAYVDEVEARAQPPTPPDRGEHRGPDATMPLNRRPPQKDGDAPEVQPDPVRTRRRK